MLILRYPKNQKLLLICTLDIGQVIQIFILQLVLRLEGQCINSGQVGSEMQMLVTLVLEGLERQKSSFKATPMVTNYKSA